MSQTSAAMREFSRSLPMLLLKAHQSVMAEFRPILREHGITEQQWRVLRALGTAESMRITQLAALTLISGPSLTRILRGLEEQKLIRRTADAGDQRATRISMLPAGQRTLATVAPRSEQRYASIAARFGDEELRSLYTLLERVPTSLRKPG
jgi:homoprotocatechuate degradation regulator HpaR